MKRWNAIISVRVIVEETGAIVHVVSITRNRHDLGKIEKNEMSEV